MYNTGFCSREGEEKNPNVRSRRLTVTVAIQDVNTRDYFSSLHTSQRQKCRIFDQSSFCFFLAVLASVRLPLRNTHTQTWPFCPVVSVAQPLIATDLVLHRLNLNGGVVYVPAFGTNVMRLLQDMVCFLIVNEEMHT